MSFMERYLKLDKTWESKVALILVVLSILVFVFWALNIRNIFETGYKEGIKECFLSQEGFVEIFPYLATPPHTTDEVKSIYEKYPNLTMTIEEMMTFLDKIKIKQS